MLTNLHIQLQYLKFSIHIFKNCPWSFSDEIWGNFKDIEKKAEQYVAEKQALRSTEYFLYT